MSIEAGQRAMQEAAAKVAKADNAVHRSAAEKRICHRIAATIRALPLQEVEPLPCKSGEGARDMVSKAVVLAIVDRCTPPPAGGAFSHTNSMRCIADDIRKGIAALTPDATQTREAELVAALEEVVRHAENRIKDGIEMRASSWRIGLEEIARDARAALNARGGA